MSFEYKVISIREELGKSEIDNLNQKEITDILNQFAKKGYRVNHVYDWNLYLLEKRPPEFYFNEDFNEDIIDPMYL